MEAFDTLRRWHPRFSNATDDEIARTALADAQLALARAHAFPSWPQFVAHLETLHTLRLLENPLTPVELRDPVFLFLEFASVERHGWHGSGNLDQANLILLRYPHVANASIHTAAVLADESTVRAFLTSKSESTSTLATAPGGPYNWDPLTYLCFSRYLRLDPTRSEAFVRTARALLEAGASANACWYDTIDDPPRRVPETAIYGAAGLAQSPGLTRLLLEYGADPNDEETPYHVSETDNNTVLQILLDSGRCNERSLATILARKADWHDEKGLALVLAHGANSNYFTNWKVTPFQHAIRRDNSLTAIEQMLDHGANPDIRNNYDHRNAFEMAAHHGRGDLLDLFAARGFTARYDQPFDPLAAACARADRASADILLADVPLLRNQLLRIAGSLLGRFACAGNLEGVRLLLDLGVSPDALWPDGDPYWELKRNSAALHVAAWRARYDILRELIARGASVNATDARGRTPLQLAVRACTDSYWKNRRQPDAVAALLAAGATTRGIQLPTGYDAIDDLLSKSKPLNLVP